MKYTNIQFIENKLMQKKTYMTAYKSAGDDMLI